VARSGGDPVCRAEIQYADRILSIEVETARTWGELTDRAQERVMINPGTDGLLATSALRRGLLATTALRHGLHVTTRNNRHFEADAALVLGPWRDS
jgi:predicted nucleic acid-binding protein